MKRKLLSTILVFVLCITAAVIMTGCGDSVPYEEYDLSQYVKVGEYKGLEYEEIKVTVTEEELQEEIDNRLASAAEVVSVESGTVENGDTINVAFEGKIDGETFEGGSSDSYDITVGETAMIDGFVEGLVGQAVGETVVLNLQFPEDYGVEDLNGKDVVFTVTIHSKQVRQIPEYNLDFVKNSGDYETLEEYEAALTEELKSSKEDEVRTEVKGVLWEQIVDSSEIIQYPEEKDEMIESTMGTYKKAAENQGVTWDAYLEESGYTEEALTRQITSYAETMVFQEMIIYAIAEKEDLQVTEKEYEEQKESMLADAGLDEDSFISIYGMNADTYFQQQGLRTTMLLEKVLDKVLEYSKPV